ncbi:MAG: hypothetical protein LBE91_09350 [Tannerella sp.]|jgi:hypothetical protein|nr:hypothetical protein [Tannerella sp.]
MILTQYFLKKKIRKLAQNTSKRPHQYRSMNDVKTILFLCNSTDWDTCRVCIEKLKAMRKTVNTAVYSPTEKDVPTWVSNYLLLRGDRDVNIWGFPSHSTQKQFMHLPADLLIDFSGEEALPMHLMFLEHPSTFKVGAKQSENSIYDFSIVPPEENKNDIQYLFDQIFTYLQTIASIPVEEEEES